MAKFGRSTKQKKSSGFDRSCREIKNLISARTITDPPNLFLKRPRLRGARGRGITYEKHVLRALENWQKRGELHGEIIPNQWFSFEDSNGHGFCQTDILIKTAHHVFILECKLTYTDWAWPQLQKLYKPVVERVYQLPAITLQVCKHVYFIPSGSVESIQSLMDTPRGGCLTWHFLG